MPGKPVNSRFFPSANGNQKSGRNQKNRVKEVYMMENAAELLKKVSATLEKYRKNKTMVSPEDLKGKYRVPFERLVDQLKDELSMYMKVCALEGLELAEDSNGYFDEFTDSVNQIFLRMDMGRRVGRAAFKVFDIAQIEQLAKEFRTKVFREAWVPYFYKHLCLYATPECFSESNPQTPRIYNSLVDKFWDPETHKWIADEEAGKPVILIYIQGGKNEQK